MGTAYFLQFLDKLALSQATLFNLRQDLVERPPSFMCSKTDQNRTSMARNIRGHRRSFTLDTSFGAGQARM